MGISVGCCLFIRKAYQSLSTKISLRLHAFFLLNNDRIVGGAVTNIRCMRRYLLIFLSMATLSSCMTTRYFVEQNPELISAHSSVSANMLNCNNNIWSDVVVSIGMQSIASDGICLRIANNYKSPIRILWDEAAYVDIYGGAHEVMPASRISINDISIANRGSSLMSSAIEGSIEGPKIKRMIPANSYIDFVVAPLDGIAVLPQTIEFDYSIDAEKEMAKLNSKIDIHAVKVVLPIEVEDKKIEYTLTFNGDFVVNRKEVVDAVDTISAISVASMFLVVVLLAPLLM